MSSIAGRGLKRRRGDLNGRRRGTVERVNRNAMREEMEEGRTSSAEEKERQAEIRRQKKAVYDEKMNDHKQQRNKKGHR